MTKDEAIQLLDLCGFETSDKDLLQIFCDFAELVALAERKRTWTQDHWTEYERGIAAAEREACAQVCENGTFLHDFSPEAVYSRACARAIRARGQV